MDKSQLETIVRDTFDGLAFLYRDTDLSDTLISRYYTGQILKERAFVDMSHLGGGMATNLRYLIASADARDISEIAPRLVKYGFVILNKGAFFKVLDIYRVEEKTQVLLLNVPEYAIGVFKRASFPQEAEIIQMAREDFQMNLMKEPLPVLKEPEWRDRTEFPLGMSEEGKLFFDESLLDLPGTGVN